MFIKMAEISDVLWIIDECKKSLLLDKHAGKAWMITACLLFPKNFDVQWEVFDLYYQQKDVEGAVRALGELCSSFQGHRQLESFMQCLVESVCGLLDTKEEEDDEQRAMRAALFKGFPPSLQKTSLARCADRLSDEYKRCRMLVELCKRFPDTVPKTGLEVLEVLTKHFYDNPPSPFSTNVFHELLVFEVIPRVASSRGVLAEEVGAAAEGQVAQKMGYFCQWLEMMANFYVSAIAKATLSGHRGPVLFSGMSGWAALNSMLFTVAGKCGWREISRCKLVGPSLAPLQRWGFFEKLPKGKDVAIGPFYVAVLLFFQMCWDYHLLVKCGDGEQDKNVLVAMPTGNSSADRPPKKRGLESITQVVFNTASPSSDDQGRECFQVALNCWEFLNSDHTYREEFGRLYKLWGALKWEWFRTFEVDAYMVNRDFSSAKTALAAIATMKGESADKTNVSRLVQLLSCHLCSDELSLVGGVVGDLMASLPSGEDSGGPLGSLKHSSDGGKGQVMLLSCDPTQVIWFVAKCALEILRRRYQAGCEENPVIGQLIVLAQINWPAEAELLWQLFRTVQNKQELVYPGLLAYITNMAVLEELVHLATSERLQTVRVLAEEEGRGVVTRGLTRERQDELRDTLRLQVRKAWLPLVGTLRTFLLRETLCLH